MKNMIYIVWNESYNTGIAIIDEQHRGIISTINSLHYFIQIGHGDEVLIPTMVMLEQYMDIHFKTEEALITEGNYNDLDAHIALHRTLMAKTKKISRNVNKDSEMILEFLKRWWLNHINKEDRKYIYCLKKLLT